MDSGTQGRFRGKNINAISLNYRFYETKPAIERVFENMAIETFTRRTQGQPEGSYEQCVRSAQFGDGCKQVSGNGLNIETQSWPLLFSG